MMTAHVAGAPIEELIYLLAPAGGVFAAVTRLAWRRIRQALVRLLNARKQSVLDQAVDVRGRSVDTAASNSRPRRQRDISLSRR
jgi:hypothetical protein